MAIQFPDFLRAPIQTPDYSGLADAVKNYYSGKEMPKDDLIKAVQAQFAKPLAEQSLLSSRLSNRKSQMEIDKMVRDLAQQKAFENQLKQALAGNSNGSSQPQLSANAGMNPDLANAVSNNMQPTMGNQAASSVPTETSTAPSIAPMTQPADTSNQSNETVVSKGEPHLSAIDQMWDNNPLSREFLKKKGYEKKQDIKFNSKTGQTTIITKYPSGKITQTTSGFGGNGTGEAPLTSKMVTKHQNIVSSIDVAIPVLQELADMGSYPRTPYRGGQYADYEGKISQAIDSTLGAFGLPMTNEGLKTIRDQVEIKEFETPKHYKKRIEKLISDLRTRQKYSAGEVKKTLKNPPIDSGNDQSDPYGLSDYAAGSSNSSGEME